WWGKLHDGRVPFLTPAGAGLLALSMLLLWSWPPWWGVLLARLGVGAGVATMVALQYAVLSAATVPEERGQIVGFATAMTHVGNLLGFVLGGLLATWWSEVGNFALAAAAYACIMAAALRLELRARRTAKLAAA